MFFMFHNKNCLQTLKKLHDNETTKPTRKKTKTFFMRTHFGVLIHVVVQWNGTRCHRFDNRNDIFSWWKKIFKNFIKNLLEFRAH